MPTWVRCRDRDTKHEFDLHENDLRVRNGSVEVIKDYPPNSGPTAQPRPAKHYIELPRAEPPKPPTGAGSDQPAEPEQKPEPPKAGPTAKTKKE